MFRVPHRRAFVAGSLSAASALWLPRLAHAVSHEVKAGDDGHFFVSAAIDNTEVEALIDTGATAVALPEKDARRIGLRPRASEFTVPVSTANGIANAARANLRRVEIGSVRVRDVEALVMPEGVLGITLIGMSFLGRLKGFRVDRGVLVLDN